MTIGSYNPHNLRHKRTLEFLKSSSQPPKTILDLGAPNKLGSLLQQEGFKIQNTDFDLDKEPAKVANFDADATTAFEIFEHLLNPLGVLENIETGRLFASVPLRLWFKSAYRNQHDPWDRHFHEFEDWQFDWLLEHAGWKIIRKEKWKSPILKIGIRPILRLFTPRYYVIEAIKK